MLLLANTIMLGFLILVWSIRGLVNKIVKALLATLFIFNLLYALVQFGWVIKQ